MLKIEKFVTPSPEQWEITIEGMRNAMNSWDRTDSELSTIEVAGMDDVPVDFILGINDRDLMMRLNKGGAPHAKYRRMLPVHVTVTAPQFWWYEADTYKVGTVRNSCSKMHKIHVAPFAVDMFSHEGCDQVDYAMGALENVVFVLENLRKQFNETQDRKYWRALLELLPSGYNMKATLSLNYQVLYEMYKWRKGHKVSEWETWCSWISELPYSELIIGECDD